MRPWVLAAVFLPCLVSAQSAPQSESYWFAGLGTIHTQKWLGSADIRRGGHYFVGYARPEKRFTFKNHPAQLALTGYYEVTKGGGFFGQPFNAVHAWGLLATARYWNRDNRELPTFIEVGWGLQITNRWIEDIDTPIASTPTIGFGVLTEARGMEFLFQATWMHTSNAGFGHRNRGQNGILLTVAVKF